MWCNGHVALRKYLIQTGFEKGGLSVPIAALPSKQRHANLFLSFWPLGCETVPNRVRVAVRLRPRNTEELNADVDFADCVELQPEVCFRILPQKPLALI